MATKRSVKSRASTTKKLARAAAAVAVVGVAALAVRKIVKARRAATKRPSAARPRNQKAARTSR